MQRASAAWLSTFPVYYNVQQGCKPENSRGVDGLEEDDPSSFPVDAVQVAYRTTGRPALLCSYADGQDNTTLLYFIQVETF